MTKLAAELENELNEAIRHGLRNAGFQGQLAGHVAHILDAIEPVIVRPRLTTQQVADAIKRDGGFIRVGIADAMIDGHFIPAGQLLDAVLSNQHAADATSEEQ